MFHINYNEKKNDDDNEDDDKWNTRKTKNHIYPVWFMCPFPTMIIISVSIDNVSLFSIVANIRLITLTTYTQHV